MLINPRPPLPPIFSRLNPLPTSDISIPISSRPPLKATRPRSRGHACQRFAGIPGQPGTGTARRDRHPNQLQFRVMPEAFLAGAKRLLDAFALRGVERRLFMGERVCSFPRAVRTWRALLSGLSPINAGPVCASRRVILTTRLYQAFSQTASQFLE
jgi:hypothetical protein